MRQFLAALCVVTAFICAAADSAAMPGRVPTAEAVSDLERAIASFETQQLEPGHLAGAKWALGRTLWKTDRPRARRLVEEAIALFENSAGSWATAKADAEAWLGGAAPP